MIKKYKIITVNKPQKLYQTYSKINHFISFIIRRCTVKHVVLMIYCACCGKCESVISSAIIRPVGFARCMY